jgi:hypothetical protein
MEKSLKKNCPLCQESGGVHFFHHEKLQRDFYQCENCELIFVDREQLISNSDERGRYDLHDNDIESDGYKYFLNRLVIPMQKLIPNKNSLGLDFGEGCNPILRGLFAEAGLKNMDGFDPFYNNDLDVFNRRYDFISCSEVLEHINNPSVDISRLITLLNVKGILGISTGLYGSQIDFKSWYYINDITHINIFTDKTVQFLAKMFNLEVKLLAKDLFIFEKK